MKFTLKGLCGSLAVVVLFLAVPSLEATPISIDFSTGMAGSGGTITISGGHASGSGILIDWLFVDGAPVTGGFNVDGLGPTTTTSQGSTGILSFDTAANFIKIEGSIPLLGIGQTTLLSGTFSEFTIYNMGSIVAFSGGGLDSKSPLLLAAIGVPLDTAFDFYGFTIAARHTGSADQTFSTDILNTGTTQVPEPASFLLLGMGMLALAGTSALAPRLRSSNVR